MTTVLQSRAQASEAVEKQSDALVVELENRLILMEGEKLQAVEQADNMRQELVNAQQELKKKLNQMTQVTNMKKMLQDKNAKIKTLRERLCKYESLEDDED